MILTILVDVFFNSELPNNSSSFSMSTLLGILMSSSVVASLLTAFFTNLLNKQMYNREYYKQILERRIRSYDLIQTLIVQLSLRITSSDKSIRFRMFSSNKQYSEFRKSLNDILLNTHWVSEEMASELFELQKLILEKIDFRLEGAGSELNRESLIQAYGHEAYEDVFNIMKKVHQILNKDSASLYSMTSFFKKRKKRNIPQITIYQS